MPHLYRANKRQDSGSSWDWRLLLAFLFITLVGHQARATHIVGGELGFTYLSGNDYRLSLDLYFDEANGSPGAIDDSANVYIYGKSTNSWKGIYVLYRIGSTLVPYTSISCTVGALKTRHLFYESQFTLDPANFQDPKGYYMVWQRCCRNSTIDNITNPGATGQTYYLEFPPLLQNGQRVINSSPTLFPPLSDYACANGTFAFDFAATDLDGDSLIYDLVSPITGGSSADPVPSSLFAPYDSVVWETGYDGAHQINGPQSLRINRTSGMLSLVAGTQGLFVFGVRCQEFRDGIKIGEVRRDFQLLVLACPVNQQPDLTVFHPNGTGIYLSTDTLLISADQNNCLTISSTDPDPKEKLSYRAVPVNFTEAPPTFLPAGGTINDQPGNDSLFARMCFPRCYKDTTKVYLVDVIVRDDGCSQPKQDTIRLAFRIKALDNYPPQLSSDLPADNSILKAQVGQHATFNLLPVDPEAEEVTVSLLSDDEELADELQLLFPKVTVPSSQPVPVHWAPTCSLPAALLDSLVTLRFLVLDPSECSIRRADTLAITFRAEPLPELIPFVPGNIITPNRDGKNEVFALPEAYLNHCKVAFASVQIFNRWGNRVYQSTDPAFRWNGERTPDGLYYYLIELNGERFKGWIEVVR